MTWDRLTSYITKPVLTTAIFPESSINLEFILNWLSLQWKSANRPMHWLAKEKKWCLTKFPFDTTSQWLASQSGHQTPAAPPFGWNGRDPHCSTATTLGLSLAQHHRVAASHVWAIWHRHNMETAWLDTQACCVNSGTTTSVVWFEYGSCWRRGLQ